VERQASTHSLYSQLFIFKNIGRYTEIVKMLINLIALAFAVRKQELALAGAQKCALLHIHTEV